MSEKDRTTDTGNMRKKLGKRSRVWWRYPRGQTDLQTDILITIATAPAGEFITRSPAIAEGPRDAGVPVEIW